MPSLSLVGGVTLCAAALLIFILPLFVPLKPTETVSVSYLAGFNNSVALFSAVGLSVLVFLLTFWFQDRGFAASDRPVEEWKLGFTFVAVVVAISAAILATGGWLVAASHMRYLGDAGYIIEQATVRHDTGAALYTQVEFAYGPLLLLPEIWLSSLLHCSITTAYFITLVIESSLGLLMLAFILNEVPMRGGLRKAALVLLALGAITPHLGLNYTFFRFASPLAALLLATRSSSWIRCALYLSIAEGVEVLISPELAMAMAVGVVVFGLLRAWQRGWPWLVTAVVPPCALLMMLLTFGRPFLHMVASFSRGALNLPVGPYPHILVLLFALVWLVPFGLGRFLTLDEALTPRLLALFAVSLAFMPAALGRCDPLHVFFNGTGVLVLSLFAVSPASQNLRRAWLAAVAVLVFWNQFVNQRPFELRTASVLRQTLMPALPPAISKGVAHAVASRRADLGGVLGAPPEPEFHLDEAALNRKVGDAAVATPLEVSPAVEDELRETHHARPGFYAFWVDVMNPAGEQRSIAETNTYPWMLLPAVVLGDNPHTLANLAMFQGFKLPYRQRNSAPYDPGVAFRENLKQHWTAVEAMGPYVLYERTR